MLRIILHNFKGEVVMEWYEHLFGILALVSILSTVLILCVILSSERSDISAEEWKEKQLRRYGER